MARTTRDFSVAARSDEPARVVFDGGEHVVEPIAALTEEFLSAAPTTLILTTTREALETTRPPNW